MPRSSAPRNLKRFRQFSLRIMLLLFTVFCVLAGWKVTQLRRQWETVEWVWENGGTVHYSHDLLNDEVVSRYDLRTVVCVNLSKSKQMDLTPLANLPKLERLYIERSRG